MKNHYDKILFVLALLILCAGLGFVAMQHRGMPESLETLKAQKPSGAEFTAEKLAPMTFVNADWPAAIDQGPEKDGLWIYSVFTPPKIWWNDELKQFEATPPVPPKVRPPFGVEFVGIERKPYQLQLTGSIEVKDGLVLMFEEDGVSGTLRARKGETIKGQNIEFVVNDVKIVRQQKDDGTLERRVVATIKDIAKDRVLELNDKERLFIDSERAAVVRAIKDPASVWKVKQAGETFQYGGGTFTIQEINFDTPAIKVEKVLPDFKDSEVVVLEPTASQPPKETPKEESSEAPAQSGAPADLFN